MLFSFIINRITRIANPKMRNLLLLYVQIVYTVKPLYSGHNWDLKIASVIKRCLLYWVSSQTGLFCFNDLLQGVRVLGYRVIDPKPLVGECLQCVKEPINKVDKNAVAVVDNNSHCKEVVDQVEISMIVSVFLSLSYCILHIFATGKRVNHGGEYGLEIHANFNFYGLEKTIKLTKK